MSRDETDPRVLQPERVIVGNCHACGRLFVVLNNHETWPYLTCLCGAAYPTDGVLAYHRQERIMPWQLPTCSES